MVDDIICSKCNAQNPPDTIFCGKCGTKIEQTETVGVTADPLIDSFVGDRFLVRERLGEGGMGVVYRAEQTAINRTVALKVLHASLTQDRSLHARFQNEAAASSRLNHPNTITVYDFGQTESQSLYIAMEYVDGKSLDDEIRSGGAMDWRRTCRLAVQMCGSLADAHQNNIVHRDLKPENVMLCRRGEEDDFVKVLDFGIAKIMEDDGTDQVKALTKTGMVFGTPQYMSPEQIRGEKVDQRTDIYSMGVIIYQMLTGVLPFVAEQPMGLLSKHLMDSPPPFKKAHVDVPMEIEAVVMAALEKEADKRPQSMKELGDRLEVAAGFGAGSSPAVVAAGVPPGHDIPATLEMPSSSGAGDGAVGSAGQRKQGLVVALTVGVLLLLGAGGAWYFLGDKEDNRTVKKNGRKTAAVVNTTTQPEPSEPPKGDSSNAPDTTKTSEDPKPSGEAQDTAVEKQDKGENEDPSSDKSEGTVTILDFGLATDQTNHSADSAKKNASVSGTPLYMAPEQVVLEDATEASDWYAFGAMLFEALTNVVPFTGSLKNMLLSKRYRNAPQVSTLRKDVSEDLDRLCTRLLVRDPLDRAGSDDIMEVFGKSGTDLTIPLHGNGIPFVGRDDEMDQLFDAFHTAEQGTPVIAMVHGVSGIGKTTLVDQFLHRLQSPGETVTLTGRCYEQESVPYKACDSLIDHLSRYLNNLPDEQVAKLLPRNVLSLGSMFPAIQRLKPLQASKGLHSLPPDLHERRILAIESLKDLFSRISAQNPLVLFVDDLCWCDEDGAKLLSSIFAPPNPPPALLLVAYRAERADRNPALKLFLERIGTLDGIITYDVPLDALDPLDAKLLAEKLLPKGTRNHAFDVAEESEGNPFFITEMSRYPIDFQPDNGQLTLEKAINSRFDTLSPSEKNILEAICIANEPMDQNFLRILTSQADVSPELRRLRDQNFIVYITDPSGLVRIYHDKIRTSVIQRMGSERNRQWHARFITTLENMDPSNAARLIDHLQKAGRSEEAGNYATRAAKQSYDTLAFKQAAKLYQLALDLNPGSRENERAMQIRLASALGNTGKGLEAAKTYLQAAEGSPVEQEIELRQLAASHWLTTGHVDRGTQELGNVLKAAGIRPYKTQVGIIASFLFNRIVLKIRGLRFQPRNARQVEPRNRIVLQAYKAALQGFTLSDRLRSLAYSLRYLRLALCLGQVDDIVFGLAQEAIHLSVAGPRNRLAVNACFKYAQDLVSKITNPLVEGYLLFAHGSCEWYLGDLVKAAEYYEQAERIYLEKCPNAVWEYSVLKSMYGTSLSGLGRWGEMQRQWDAWTADAEERGDLYLLTVQRLWPSGVYRWLAADRPDKVWQMLSLGLRDSPTTGDDLLNVFAVISTSYTSIYCGNYQDAYHPLEKKLTAFLKTPAGNYSPSFKSILHSRLAYGALAHALMARNKNKMLDIAERRAKKLMKDNSPMALAFVPVIRAAIAWQKGDDKTATALLRDAIDAFNVIEYKLYAAAARRQLGRIIGGDEGKALVQQADRTMGEEDVVNPERIAAMLAPGFFM